MPIRPPGFATLDEFLNDRSHYPDDTFRSVKMGMLRELREYIENLELSNEALAREQGASLPVREAALKDLAKHAMDLLAGIKEN